MGVIQGQGVAKPLNRERPDVRQGRQGSVGVGLIEVGAIAPTHLF
jgi:hypothetical protein